MSTSMNFVCPYCRLPYASTRAAINGPYCQCVPVKTMASNSTAILDPTKPHWCSWCIAWTDHPTESCPVLEADRQKMRAEAAIQKGEEPDL